MSEPSSGNGVSTVNPATGETLEHYPFLSDTALDALLNRAERGFHSWRAKSLGARLDLLHRFAAQLRARKEDLARLAVLEMGKTITAARAEIDKCASVIDWYGQHAPALLRDRPMEVPAGKAHLSYAPTGIVLAVMPWNFPYWQIIRAAIPIMAGGNGFIVKPAENTLGCGLLLNDIARECDLDDVFISANLAREQTARVIADSRISGVTVTGSVRVGRILAGLAGQNGKKTVLELGGSDPFIVLADADLDKAVDAAIAARFANCGQVCIAAKRIIVEATVAEAFTERFLEKVRALRLEDPMDDGAFIGPMARPDLRDGLHEQVRRSIAEGARLVVGGEPVDRPGAWYEPTALLDVTPGMTAFREELFGPVACIITARDVDHAIELANRTEYGLGASLWTQDDRLALSLSKRIESGGVFINKVTASDPALPIGGVKSSGYGRELTELGLHEFMNIKTVWAA
ncbi:NAD-dependent succinate-semialdehyde dehydrogenase [Asaia krungthepensis]|uniref:NAD-dependent aldehyde dehydrogenase n=1 Tax=Asaia krungthepensis NRIC 0535 TaxID=1307925 RepID=A0ABQ0Q6A2_9PROT|nr:NAD-dependent succinate-semialdehyde dehydrogenase [Asaia krungthepensis]GBQ93225.1 NAD-dependent aldehyde dehydrogenase [Asaia krungthepensis NRIC 0535]